MERSTSKELGELLDIGDRCGDSSPLLTRFLVADPNEQGFLRSRAASGGRIATGRHYGGGDFRRAIGKWLGTAHVLYSPRTSKALERECGRGHESLDVQDGQCPCSEHPMDDDAMAVRRKGRGQTATSKVISCQLKATESVNSAEFVTR